MTQPLRVCYPPDPNPRKPKFRAPAGTCDTHFHVFGPPDRFPYSPKRVYTPPAAPVEHFFNMAAIVGIERGVVVTPTAHGIDNSATLDAIAKSKGAFRGMAKIDETFSDDALARLHEGGIRGIRFNMIEEIGGGVNLAMFERLAARIKPLGWCIDFHVMPGQLMEYGDWFRRLPIPVIIDHYARVPFEDGVGQKPFQYLLELARDEKFWVKVSGAERQKSRGFPEEDAVPFAIALAEVAPDRLIWGTDWPHGSMFKPNGTPNDGDIMDLVPKLMPDPAIRQKVLVDNPARLFGFGS